MSEYDPIFSRTDGDADGPADLDRARELFAAAGRPYLSSPWGWLGWAILLPLAALSTPQVFAFAGWRGGLLLWSVTVLVGGAIEAAGFLGARRRLGGGSPLARWVFRLQGNTSLVAAVLSALLLWLGAPEALPGVWLLLLGQSFVVLGGLAFSPLRHYGRLYQATGLVALWPGAPALELFAAATGLGNLGMAWAIWRRGRGAG